MERFALDFVGSFAVFLILQHFFGDAIERLKDRLTGN